MATGPQTPGVGADPTLPAGAGPDVTPPTQPAQGRPGADGGRNAAWQGQPGALRTWTSSHSLALLLIVVVIGALGLFPGYAQFAFVATVALMALFITIAGHGVVGFWRGVFIDERNKLSLSRLQLVLWMIVVLSGFLTAALSNVSHGVSEPLKVVVPAQLWMLMGISTTSLVASPLIRTTKAAESVGTRGLLPEVADAKVQKVKEELARQNVRPETVGTNGQLVVWHWPEDARLADLFQGDEVANAAHLDLGKVQMFFFTLVLVFAYAVALCHAFAAGAAVPQLPPVDQGMVALLGISHAGFLSNNAIPRA